MSPTRRQVLLAGAGGISALAGCSAFSSPSEPLVIAVRNYSDSRHQGQVLIERQGRELVNQYLEVGAAEPNSSATVETKIAIDVTPKDVPLDVTASFGEGLKASGQHTLGCTDQYTGRAIYVTIEKETPVNVQLVLACYDEFPTSEAVQGGTT